MFKIDLYSDSSTNRAFKNLFETAHAFLKYVFLLNALEKNNFRHHFGIGVKFPIKWRILIYDLSSICLPYPVKSILRGRQVKQKET